MKLGLLFSVLVLFSCSSARQQWMGESTVDDDAFSREQAERMLGAPVEDAEILRSWGCLTYDKIWQFTGAPDAVTGKAAHIIVFVESSPNAVANVPARYAEAARRSGMKDSNHVVGVGDEAHFRESQSERWLSARRGMYTIDLKLRGSSSATTAEFLRVAGEVVGRLNLDLSD